MFRPSDAASIPRKSCSDSIAGNRFLAAWQEFSDFVCLTTNRLFDPVPRTDWETRGERILALLGDLGFGGVSRAVFAQQVHGNAVRRVSDSGPGVSREVDCDGLVCRGGGVALVIQTADCLPIVLADREKQIAGAFHAGWRGTRARILQRGIGSMISMGAKAESLEGWIGPRICPGCYEVSEELKRDFQDEFGTGPFLGEGRRLNLPGINRLQAAESGMLPERLVDAEMCTACAAHTLYSHRRHGRNRGTLLTICFYKD